MAPRAKWRASGSRDEAAHADLRASEEDRGDGEGAHAGMVSPVGGEGRSSKIAGFR
jgi:hypothetical protein